jgi:hypothetical protein
MTAILLTLLYGTLILLIQRSERRRRLLVALLLIPIIGVIHWYANVREVGGESNTAVIIAIVFNVLFWLLIGRYNPVGSSDDIKVIGLDD